MLNKRLAKEIAVAMSWIVVIAGLLYMIGPPVVAFIDAKAMESRRAHEEEQRYIETNFKSISTALLTAKNDAVVEFVDGSLARTQSYRTGETEETRRFEYKKCAWQFSHDPRKRVDLEKIKTVLKPGDVGYKDLRDEYVKRCAFLSN